MRKHAIKNIALAVVLLVTAMPVAANAALTSINTVPESRNIDVKAKYQDNSEKIHTYKIDLEWGAMEFTYVNSGVEVWNPDTHEYDVSGNSGWNGSGNQLTVTNHSDMDVVSALSFSSGDGYENLTGKFQHVGASTITPTASYLLKSAENTAVEDAPSQVTNFILEGTPDSSMTEFQNVGQITVSIKEK